MKTVSVLRKEGFVVCFPTESWTGMFNHTTKQTIIVYPRGQVLYDQDKVNDMILRRWEGKW